MTARIAILGDICPRWGNASQFDTGRSVDVFHDVLTPMRAADYCVGNLECPATESERGVEKTSMNLRCAPGDLCVLADAGMHAVALANNHILDYGVSGLRDTLANLDAVGIADYGAGSADLARKPHVVQFDGIRVSFLAFAEREFNCAVDYGEGANLWNDLDGIRSIRDAKYRCDYLVVQYHGGIEHHRYPSPNLQKRCRAMAEAGADLVLCQHSHIIGTREAWSGSEILYGQGNTVFGKSPGGDDSWDQGLLCDVALEKRGKETVASVKYVPVVATTEGERLADDTMADRILFELEERSARIGDLGFVRNQWDAFCSKEAPTYLPMLFGWGVNAIRANRLLGGRLVSLLVGRKKQRNAMNLVRCDAHREIVQTILEDNFYGK